jgi:Icc-related predicted phosphoesterase
MRVLSFADMHGNRSAFDALRIKAKDADLIICAGDISVFERMLDELIFKLAELGKPTLILHGNHENTASIKDVIRKHDNIVFLHKGLYELNGISFIGYGGGGFSHKDDEFLEFFRKVKPFLKQKTVLVTHGPPHGTAVDFVGNSHVGNKDFLEFIREVQPVLAVSGHIHETAGYECSVGKTRVINPGAFGKVIDI